MNRIIYSNTAIDLGGKYTGVDSYTAESMPDAEDIDSYIIAMPNQGNHINYTVKDRTATRHHRRSIDRFKKARRLINLVLSYAIKRELTKSEKEAISSLMKRRGYTRLETEIDLESLSECSPEFFADNLDCINNDSSLFDQFSSINSNLEATKEIYLKLSKVDWDEKIKTISDKKDRALCKSALIDMKKACASLISQEEFGHKHRKQYLEAIALDIKHDARLKSLNELLGGSEKLYRCVGNVSNLQLRALRWYFNDITMKGGSSFKADRFKSIWIRAYQYFHYPDKETVTNLLEKIKESGNIVETLCSIDPVSTIPHYEDQNNRRPPIDNTLLLNPKALDDRYGNNWEKWTENLAALVPEVRDELDEIINLTDRKSRRLAPNSQHYTKDKLKHSYMLHRLLDLSFVEEHICLRVWANNPESKKSAYTNNALHNALSGDYDAFLKLAQEYYRESDCAKRGLWLIVDNPILEMSGIHPPMKNKTGVIDLIISSVLCTEKLIDVNSFKKNIWKAKVNNKSSVCSICKKIEDIRKDYGNAFKIEYELVLSKAKENKKNLSVEERELLDVSEDVKLVSIFINNKLGNSELDSPKFANPFSLAQLYTILEKEPNGFSRNCLAVIKENSWRMRNYYGLTAICTRLVAETIRPFDGALGNILGRQAYEIAKRKVKEIISLPNLTNTQINLGLLIEENKFEFTSSIAQIKIKTNEKDKKIKANAKKKENKAKEQAERQEQRWLSKEERIIKAANNICAYTGESLNGNKCEVDHIVSRSFTKESMGTIFNSEANLIYVSQKGNQHKKNEQYTLEQLNVKYLDSVFKTHNISEIKRHISDTVEQISTTNPKFLFDSMSESEIQAVRHALFMPGTPAYFKVISILSKQNTTRVNGTQAWLIREIIRKIKVMLSDWLKENNNTILFNAWKVSSSETHFIREQLAKNNPTYKKKGKQPITSHAIDALCVLAAACDDKSKTIFLGKEGTLEDISKPENLSALVPKTFEVIEISNKQFIEKKDKGTRKLYKETIYAEHFLPVMVLGSKVKIGFDWKDNNYECTKGGEKLLTLLSPFFTESIVKDNKFHTYRIDNKKAFSFFHKFSEIKDKKELQETYDCLQALYYSTKKENVKFIYDSQKKKFKETKEVLSNKKFNISKKSSITSGIKLKQNKQGTIILPSKSEWEEVLSKFEQFKKQEITDIDSLIKDVLFNKNRKTKLYHSKVKQVFSLPILYTTSPGIRLKRRDYNNRSLYQLVEANTLETVISKGFPIENNKINWNGTITTESYSGENITLVKTDDTNSSEPSYVKMTEKRTVYKSDNIKIMMSPGTKTRRYIFVEQDFKSFVQCLGTTAYSSYFDLPNEIKIKDKLAAKEFGERLMSQIDQKVDIGYPRGSIKLFIIGETVNYYYSVELSNSKMNSAFENAYTK